MATTPALLDRPQVVQLLEEVVAEHGRDHVYELPEDQRMGSIPRPRCRYIFVRPDGLECGCIVGCVLVRAGVPAEKLTPSALDHLHGQGARVVVALPAVQEHVAFTDDAVAALVKVQTLQDAGGSWGHCLDEVAGRATAAQ